MAKRNTTAPQRFWSKVEKTDSCWTWTGFRDRDGYGQFWLDDRQQKAHRVSYAWAQGGAPTDSHVDHTCHNTSCVRPAHLRPVDHKQNQENRAGAQRNSKSGVLGVSPSGRRWRAQVVHKGKHYRAGHYGTIPEAEAAVIALRNELFTHNDFDRSGTWSSELTAN